MKILSISLTVIALLFLAPTVYGCGCKGLNPEQAFDRAETVFIGKMISGTEKNIGDDKGGSKPKLEAGDVTFEIEALQMFKGIRGSRRSVIVNVPSRHEACEPYGLIAGEKYFVYAYDGGEDFGEPVHLGTCARIASWEENEDIDFIRRLGEIGYGTIKGYISLDTHELSATYSLPPISSLPNLSLQITGPNGFSQELPIDASGNFEITGLKAGIYRVTPQLPSDYESKNKSEETTIAGFSTHYLTFWAQSKSRVSGVIHDVNGIGFDQRIVALENSTRRILGGSLNPDGRFEIQGVPPGEYLMYMEFRSDDLYETRKYYYPGTYDAARATKLTFGLSDLKSGIKFALPTEFRVRKVSGTVFWPDGNPVQGVTVFLSGPSRSKVNRFRPQNFPAALTDKNGQFSLNGIGGVSQWLNAQSYKKDGTLVCSTPVKILFTMNVAGKKLVLSRQGVNVFCPVPKKWMKPPNTPARLDTKPRNS